MSVSIREVIENGGYDLTTVEDARWLIEQEAMFDDLIDEAEELIEQAESDEDCDE